MSKAYGINDPLAFGKYAGLSIRAIARFDPAYLLWIKRNLASFRFTTDALELAKTAWTKDYYRKLERQNGWAWGCGAAVKRDADQARSRAIDIEIEERRNAARAHQETSNDG